MQAVIVLYAQETYFADDVSAQFAADGRLFLFGKGISISQ